MSEVVPSACSEYVTQARQQAIQSIYQWTRDLAPDLQEALKHPKTLQRMGQLTFLDGYWRIRQTTHLILKAIDSLSAKQEHDAARYWIKHLNEEAAHDDVMLLDIIDMLGSKEAAQVSLQTYPMSPPTAALTGYFAWQAAHGNPHLLIVLRDFLENFVIDMTPEHVQQVENLRPSGVEVLKLHQALDIEHAAECTAYIDQYFKPEQTGELVWSVHFVGACIRDSQIWAANYAAMEAMS